MISCKLYGRLGNTMMQMAATIGFAKKYELEYAFPVDTVNPHVFPRYFRHLNSIHQYDISTWRIQNEEGHNYNHIGFPMRTTENIILDGFWQSYLYWDFCIHDIRNAFNFNYKTELGLVGIHWRMADYRLYPTKHPIMTEQYFNTCISYFIVLGFRNFMFFSDEIEVCKQFAQKHYSIQNFLSIYFSQNKNELEDFEILMNCQHQIISNSSFSLMAALLNPYPAKIVLTPYAKDWFGIDNKHLDTDDLLPKEFIKISQ